MENDLKIEYKITESDDFKVFRETISEKVYKLVKDYNFWLCERVIGVTGSIQDVIYRNHISKKNKNNHKIIVYRNRDNTELSVVIFAKNFIVVDMIRSRFCTFATSNYVLRALVKASEKAKNDKFEEEIYNSTVNGGME